MRKFTYHTEKSMHKARNTIILKVVENDGAVVDEIARGNRRNKQRAACAARDSYIS